MEKVKFTMNFKKTLCIATTISCATPVMAAPSGFFLGGLLGATALKGEHTFTIGSEPGVSKINKMAPHFGLNTGYLMSITDGKACVGAEIYGIFGGPVSKKQLISGGLSYGMYSVQVKSIMGASIITGMMLNPKLMGYARVGYEMETFNFKYSDLTFGPDLNYKKKIAGLAPGGGMLIRITPQLSVMVDATIPVVAKVTVQNADAAGRKMEYQPNMQRITCRVIYAF